MLSVSNIEVIYNHVILVLMGVSLDVQEGSIVALLGANGAGKTTTLRSICGMVRTAGAIRFDGHAINGKATEAIVKQGIAHVPEGRGTFGSLTAEENLQLGAMAGENWRNLDATGEPLYVQGGESAVTYS